MTKIRWGLLPLDQPPCILPPEATEKGGTGRASSKPPGPSEAVGKQEATRPNTRSKPERSMEPLHRRARIKVQGGVAAPAAVRRKERDGLNAAIDVGKHQMELRWAVRASCLRSPIRHAHLRAWHSGSPNWVVRGCRSKAAPIRKC